MVTALSKDGKIILQDVVPVPDGTAKMLEDVIKANPKVVKATMKDLSIDHWIETKGDKKFTVVSKKYTNDSELDVLEEIKNLQLTHNRFVTALAGMKQNDEEHQKPLPEDEDVDDNEEEEFLKYAFICKLQEMIESCAAIIIAIPK